MTDFLSSLKADLTDRRLRPFVALVVIALLGTVGYVAFGGGGSGSTAATPSASAPPAAVPSGLAASANVPNTAVAETTEGTSQQHHGVAHNPFAPVPQAKAAATTASASGSSSSSSSTASSTSSSSSSSSGSSSESKTSSEPAKPATPAKPKPTYHVAILLGLTPPPPPAPSAPLTPYENLKLDSPFPSAKSPLIVYRGVTSGGKSATFSIVSEPILHGAAKCLPSATQCEAIDLAPGKSETLELVSAEDQLVSYELTVVSIVAAKASAASTKDLLKGTSKAGRELLRHAGLVAIPGLQVSSQAGVFVFAGHSATAARAHAAARARARARH